MIDSLPQVQGEYKFNYNLSHLTWFKTGGPAKILYKPKNLQDLQDFLHQTSDYSINSITLLGAGSNVIIRDKGIDGVVIKLGQEFGGIEINQNKIKVGAACLNYNLAKFCANHSVKNFEFLVGIPGTIGGGIAMNAGAYGSEFKDIVAEIEAIDFSGKIHKFSNKEIGFMYRGNNLPANLIFLNASFNLEKGCTISINSLMNEIINKRELTQPIKMRTGGSTFANPCAYSKKAWELINDVGLRGYNINGATMSDLHCNFMINKGGAKARDLEDLGELVRKKVYEKFGVLLQWEIKIMGLM